MVRMSWWCEDSWCSVGMKRREVSSMQSSECEEHECEWKFYRRRIPVSRLDDGD